ncbi:unnamed protein product [marine sediment metagenome]|uniref:Uncharacterized protein n=1 Tax=marine sediment metagenome TaxID=412755 RepID=X0Z1W5_9ZZZZ
MKAGMAAAVLGSVSIVLWILVLMLTGNLYFIVVMFFGPVFSLLLSCVGVHYKNQYNNLMDEMERMIISNPECLNFGRDSSG